MTDVALEAGDRMRDRRPKPRPTFRVRVRHAVLTAHIIMSVGLLGDSAGFLAVAIRAAASEDQQTVIELMHVLDMFSVVFGIPLSFGTLFSGIALGLGTKWGVLRYPWVTLKLLLIVSVMLVGGLVIAPAHGAVLEGIDGATTWLIAAASYDVLALAIATGLSVFKPGKPFQLTNVLGASRWRINMFRRVTKITRRPTLNS